MKQVLISVSGAVQGVGYRYFIRYQAERLGLTGYAENKPDGSVEILAEGPEADLKILIEIAERGPAHAQVEKVNTTWGEAEGNWKIFDIL